MSFFLSVVSGQGGIKPCGAPGTLTLSPGSPVYTAIDLSWSAPSDVGGGVLSGYHIQVSTNGSSWSDQVADTGSTGTTYTASSLTNGTTYYFRVAGINEAGTGTYGNEPSRATTAYAAPGAPGTLSLSNGSTAQTQINLSWSAPSDDGGQSVTGYRIKKDGSVLVADTSSTGTTYTATGLSSGTSYNFNVAAINSVGTGADGNTPSHTTATYNISATGGTITTAGGYRQHVFTSSGTFNITSNPDSVTIDVISVGGGGGSGYSNNPPYWPLYAGGGSGGGAVIEANGDSGATGARTVTIGAGGSGAVGGDTEFPFAGYTPRRSQGGSKSLSNNYSGNGGGRGHQQSNSGVGYSDGQNSNTVDGHIGQQGGRGFITGGQYRAGGGGGGGASNAGACPDASSSGNPPIHAIGGGGSPGEATWYNTLGAGGGGGGHLDVYPGSLNVSTGGTASNGGGVGGGGVKYPVPPSGYTDGTGVPGNGTANTGGGSGGSVDTPSANPNAVGGSGIVIIRYAYS